MGSPTSSPSSPSDVPSQAPSDVPSKAPTSSPTSPACWTYLEGLWEKTTHTKCSKPTYDDLEEAQAACVANQECFGIAKQSNHCNGEYRTNVPKNAVWKGFSDWQPYGLWAYRLDDRTGAACTPSDVPSDAPSVPSDTPSNVPSKEPSDVPSVVPSQAPTDVPTIVPVVEPTHRPTDVPRTCWTYQEGYIDASTMKHCPSDAWVDLAEAQAACLADPECFGIHKIDGSCGGKYRKTKKSAIWQFRVGWEAQELWSYRLDLPCAPTDPCWTYLEGYLDKSSFKHCPSASWDDLEEAQAACVADLACFGIHKINNRCGGKYRKTKKNVSWTYHSNWKSYDLWAYRLDDRTCAAANSRRLSLSPPSTSPRQLNSQEKEQSATAGVAVVASKNSASFATTIKLSTMVTKDSGTAIPSHRGTVMTITFSLLLALVSHFLCL